MKKLSSKEVIAQLDEVKRLPQMPQVLIKLNRLLSKEEDVNVEAVAQLIRQDPRLNASLLKLVNTVRYAAGRPIFDISEAVARLGVNDLRVMVLAISYNDVVKSTALLNVSEFLRYSLLSAYIAKGLSQCPELQMDANQAFMIGLMHEIGVYLLMQHEGLNYNEILVSIQSKRSPQLSAEQVHLGFSHANIGARLLKQWDFPKPVVLGVLGHHAPNLLEKESQRPAYIGYLTEAAAFYLLGSNGIVKAPANTLTSQVESTLTRLRIDKQVYLDVITEAQQEAQRNGVR